MFLSLKLINYMKNADFMTLIGRNEKNMSLGVHLYCCGHCKTKAM